LRAFFGAELARRLRDEGRRADVLIANNVLAHTPDPNDLVEGISVLLAAGGLATIENAYVRDLIGNGAFDTIYHEHFSYLSCTALDSLVRRHRLALNAVEHFPAIQGGSLRWHVGRELDRDASAEEYLRAERESGLTRAGYY